MSNSAPSTVVATWNIKYSTPAADLVRAAQALVTEHGIEIFCLQEVSPVSHCNPGTNVYRQLQIGLEMYGAFAPHPIPYGFWWEGLAIFSRYPTTRRQRVRLNYFRTYLQVTVAHPQLEAMQFGCVHLSAPKRRAQEIGTILEHASRRQTILAGDFNLTTNWPGMQAVAQLYHPDGCTEPTCNGRKIDSICASPDLEITQCWTPQVDISDHNPVVACIRKTTH